MLVGYLKFEIHAAGNYHKKNIQVMLQSGFYLSLSIRERSGSVVECLTRDRRVAGSSLTGVTALWSLSKTHLS